MADETPAKVTTLGYALLGLLARGEKTGYELAQGLKNPVSYFWYAQHSQIYPELARLEAADLVQFTLVAQSERPDKKVYHLTPQGQEALRAWVTTPTNVPKKRDELVLKAYSLWVADPASALQMLRDHAQIHATNIAEFERRLAWLKGVAPEEMWHPDSPYFGVHAVIRRGIGYEREYMEWCDWVAQCLNRIRPAERTPE